MRTDLPHAWARLHPLSPVVKGARAVFAVLVLTASRSFDPRGRHWTQLFIDLAIPVVAAPAAAISWWVTRWRVVGTELQLETGLLRRQSIRVPLLRVQAIDVVRPLAARAFGISELRIVLAGNGGGKSKLAYLGDGRARQVRAQLLAVGAGLAPETPEAPERQLAAVPNSRLYLSALLLPALVLLAAAPFAMMLAFVAPEAVFPLLGGVFPIVFAFAAGIARRVNDEFSFTLAGSPDGLRLRSGLFMTRAETIPLHRIQAVRLVEPLLWKPFGSARGRRGAAARARCWAVQPRRTAPGPAAGRPASRGRCPAGKAAPRGLHPAAGRRGSAATCKVEGAAVLSAARQLVRRRPGRDAHRTAAGAYDVRAAGEGPERPLDPGTGAALRRARLGARGHSWQGLGVLGPRPGRSAGAGDARGATDFGPGGPLRHARPRSVRGGSGERVIPGEPLSRRVREP